MKNFYLAFSCLLVIACQARAQFSNYYSASNWTLSKSSASNGTVSIADAPSSITISGSDGGPGGSADTDFSIITAGGGIFSFSWSYSTVDGPGFDPASVLIGGVSTGLTSLSGGNAQSGNYTSVYVAAGTTIGFRVRSTDNQMGMGVLTISNFSAPGGILPVVIHSFTASLKNTTVLLEWQASQEQHFSRFEIERSPDGTSFEKIATVAAQNQQYYSATDKEALAGTGYYRLRMVDQDGSARYSKIISIKREANTRMQVWPNPAREQLTLGFIADRAGKDLVQIYDAGGRLVYSQPLTLAQGANNISLNTSDLVCGSYFLRLSSGGQGLSFIRE